jgi:RHS repeat-associated protein
LDQETGLYYYGARYYDPKTSIWQSVDPLTEKMPGWSPYNYVEDSPIVRTDPDGQSGTPIIDKKNKTITIHSKFMFYGSKANAKLSQATANEISNQYNNTGGKVTIDGQEYSVKYKISYQTVSVADAEKMASTNKKVSVNFIRI